MPAELCPRCGTARTAGGCVCFSDPSAADTAVLPHVEGPPLVRPYVAAAPVEQPGPGPDPFATRLTPPVGFPPMPPVPPAAAAAQTAVLPGPVTPAGVPLGPVPPTVAPSAAQTTLLPPVPAQAPRPGAEADTQLIPPLPPQPYAAPQQPVDADGPWEPGAEPAPDLGMFAFREENAPAPGSRAERRVEQQQAAGRRRMVIAGAMVGLAAVGAGLALALSPASPDRADKALPAPTDSGIPYPGPMTPTVEPTSVTPSPAAAGSTKASKAPTTKAPASPSTVAAAPPSPTAVPSTSSSRPGGSASPSPSASVRDLRRGDSGADVTQLQTRLVDVLFWKYDDALVTGTFDKQTEQAVRYFQSSWGIRGEDGWYGPKTRAALANYPA